MPFTVMYHGVVPDRPVLPWASLGVIGQSDFERQLRLLKRRFRVLHPEEVLEGLRCRKVFSKNTALVTLDDGFQNVLEYALPVAESLGVPLLTFICDGPMDGGEWLWFCRVLALERGTHRPVHAIMRDLSSLSLEEVEERLLELGAPRRSDAGTRERFLFDGMNAEALRRSVEGGMITAGGHTTHHPNLVVETAEVMRREVRANKERLESEIGRPVHFFAYPGAYADARVAEAVKSCGYEAAFVVAGQPSAAPKGLERYFLPREGIYRPGVLRFLVKSVRARWRAPSV